MPPPTAVVFDLGKVLLDFDYRIAVRKMAPHCALAAPELQCLIDQSPLLHRYESGGMTSREFFAEIAAQAGYRGTFEQFRECFGDIFSEIPRMIELHATLRARGVPTFIFSNTNEIAVHHIRRRFPFFAGFDGYVLSYEAGRMKPHPHIYQRVEALTGRRGTELLYLDDRLENVQTGEARGWRTIHHAQPEESWNVVRQLRLI
jgi:putative hydrolase of the HAD superfamily